MHGIVLQRKLDRAQQQVAALEQLIEERSRALYSVQERLRATGTFLQKVLATIRTAVLVVDNQGKFVNVNPAACELLGYAPEQLTGAICGLVFPDAETPASLIALPKESRVRTRSGEVYPVLFAAAPLIDDNGEREGTVCVAHDLREKKQLELQLRHAQKLESVGQLAAGVAHEINTPAQFAGDSVAFLGEAFTDLCRIMTAYRELAQAAQHDSTLAALTAPITATESEVDLEFLLEEVPQAVRRAADGITRIATIVQAMKAFAHPGNGEKAPQDLNQAIRTTLEVCRNEYKYIADVDLELSDIPPVTCNLGDINQVLLNLIVNAAHAIDTAVQEQGGRGQITLRTTHVGEFVEIRVQDTGAGIPEKVKPQLFQPFFTTKPVGKGTGQGLAISRTIVVDKHGGTLTFDSDVGKGTTFTIRLPVDGTKPGATS
jgi:signal transduction histidine kinase